MNSSASTYWIRPYTPADKDALLALLRLNIPTYFHPSEEAEFSQYLEQQLDEYFVVVEQGVVVGAGGLNRAADGRSVRISWDFVHPHWQGRGVGSRLLAHRIERIRQMPEVETIIVRTSQLVYPFYEKGGFILMETVKDYWAPGFDLYRMEMKIR